MDVAALILGTFINALHAVSAAMLVIMSVPETLSEFDLSVNVVFANLVDDGVWCTHGPKGGGDLIFIDGCSSSLPMEMWGFLGGMAFTFIVLGEGLPIPGIDFFEDFPLLTLAVANLELVNSL